MAEAEPILRPGADERRAVTLPARPEALRLDPAETAVVVIDMQNAYASEGGYVDLAGFNIRGAAGVIGRIAAVLDTARAALTAAGFAIDYVGLADADTLAPDPGPERPRRLLAAARMGTTRLIDNVPVAPEQGQNRAAEQG